MANWKTEDGFQDMFKLLGDENCFKNKNEKKICGLGKMLKQRSVKRTNFVEPGYNYLTCHNNFPFNSQSIKVYFNHYSNTVLSKLPG